MHTGTFPFKEARITDPYYKHIAARDYNSFWQMHEALHKQTNGDKTDVVFSESFKDMISGMLAFQPFQRPSLADIVFHQWFSEGKIAVAAEVREEMAARYERIDKKKF